MEYLIFDEKKSLTFIELICENHTKSRTYSGFIKNHFDEIPFDLLVFDEKSEKDHFSKSDGNKSNLYINRYNNRKPFRTSIYFKKKSLDITWT